MNIIEAAKAAGFRERNGSIRVQHSNGSFVIVDEHLSRFAAIIRAQALEDAKTLIENYPFWLGTTAKAEICNAIESMKGQP